MIEILLLSILALALAAFVGLSIWRRKADDRILIEKTRQTIATWEDEVRREQHQKFNTEFLDSLTEEDRERFIRMWRGE